MWGVKLPLSPNMLGEEKPTFDSMLVKGLDAHTTTTNKVRVWYTQLNPWFWIQIQKIAGPTAKNHVWYKGFKWGFKSQLEFYVGPMANLSSPLQLFLNPSRIQIRTQFFCGSQFLPLLGPPNSFLPFSLSLLHCFSASLSLSSRPLQVRPPFPDYLSSLISAKTLTGPHNFTPLPV